MLNQKPFFKLNDNQLIFLEIMKINFSSLTTKNLATLGQRVITISDAATHAVVKDHPLLLALKAANAEYDAVYAKSAFSGKGVLVAEADVRRDDIFGGLKSVVVGYSKINGFTLQQDAIDIYAVIQKYGIELDRYSYSEESAQLKKLLEELAKPDNVTKIQHLQLAEVVASLKLAQENFERVFAEQAGANAELRQTESASSSRRNFETAIRNYLNVVKAMYTLPGWKELYTELDEVVKAVRNSKMDTPKKDSTTTVTQ